GPAQPLHRGDEGRHEGRRRAPDLHRPHDHGQAQRHGHRLPPLRRGQGAGRADRLHAPRHGQEPPRERRPLPQGQPPGVGGQGRSGDRGHRGLPAPADGRGRHGRRGPRSGGRNRGRQRQGHGQGHGRAPRPPRGHARHGQGRPDGESGARRRL
ncbi:MAG: Transamidase GatB domain protein, partial [uncultured Acetobacteraceae bacterium]